MNTDKIKCLLKILYNRTAELQDKNVKLAQLDLLKLRTHMVFTIIWEGIERRLNSVQGVL